MPLPVRLTPREIAVLRLVSNGAPGHEAAQALGIGHETIRTHLRNAQIKLGARNEFMPLAKPCGRTSYPEVTPPAQQGRTQCLEIEIAGMSWWT